MKRWSVLISLILFALPLAAEEKRAGERSELAPVAETLLLQPVLDEVLPERARERVRGGRPLAPRTSHLTPAGSRS